MRNRSQIIEKEKEYPIKIGLYALKVELMRLLVLS